ncbi:unnamed protein product [Linum trigynum]|uniref:AMP-dependent synthetase/ligase domain-containing protein n=1 Tax=Linum trigynum TaxID=586398 RepID=A0AAV2FTS4_9ROSI
MGRSKSNLSRKIHRRLSVLRHCILRVWNQILMCSIGMRIRYRMLSHPAVVPSVSLPISSAGGGVMEEVALVNCPPPSAAAILHNYNNNVHRVDSDLPDWENKLFGQVIALLDSASGYSISYQDLFPLVKSTASALHKLGIRHGDVVLLVLPNSICFPVVFLAVLYAGAVVTTMNPLATVVEIHITTFGSSGKDPKRTSLAKDLEQEETLLKQCVQKLKSVEASRASLVSQLRDALNDQESQLEVVRTQMQVAQAQVEEVNIMIKRLNDEDYVPKATTATQTEADTNGKAGHTPKKTAAAIAAEVADKLAASSSSQMIMHSVLSSFAAEAAKTGALRSTPVSSSANDSVPDPAMFMSAQQPLSAAPSNHPYHTMQNQIPSSQPQFHMMPNPSSQQYLQPPGGIVTPYGYGSISSLPSGPPPPPPPYMINPMAPMAQQPPSQVPITQQQQMTLTQQQAAGGPPGFRPLQPPGMVYYGHHPSSHSQ